MHTKSDALAHITEAIQATGVVEDAAAEYDLDSIANEAYKAAGGTWDLTNLDTGTFWWMKSGTTSSRSCVPVTAPPPACWAPPWRCSSRMIPCRSGRAIDRVDPQCRAQ